MSAGLSLRHQLVALLEYLDDETRRHFILAHISVDSFSDPTEGRCSRGASTSLSPLFFADQLQRLLVVKNRKFLLPRVMYARRGFVGVECFRIDFSFSLKI